MRFSTDLYRLNICLGATLFLVLQALVNMGVVTGLLPTKGISLPFLSYGGTNLVIMSSMVGLILNCIRDASKAPFLAKEIRG
jgi:cell division protein FtsW